VASGKVHDFIGIAASFGCAAIPFHFGQSWGIPLGAGVFLGTLLFSPDLDTKSKPYKRWGVLKIIWWPYQKFVKHRSALSHSPILGTLGRLGYLFLVLLGVYSALVLAGKVDPVTPEDIQGLAVSIIREGWLLILFVIGLELASLLHLLADGILFAKPKSRKGKRSRRRRRK